MDAVDQSKPLETDGDSSNIGNNNIEDQKPENEEKSSHNTNKKESVSKLQKETESQNTSKEEPDGKLQKEIESENTSKEESVDKLQKETESQSRVVDEANLHYEEGVCIYTDPETKSQYVWDEKTQEWVPKDSSLCEKDYVYDGKTYTYTDKDSNLKYAWDEDKKEWKNAEKIQNDEAKPEELSEIKEGEENKNDEGKKKPTEITKQDMTKGQYSFENNTHVYTDPSDGSKYFWDKERNAWIPKVDDDFLAHYQMSYGFVDPNANQEDKKKEEPKPPVEVEDKQKRKAPQEPTWFEVGEESTKVYVSGLPLDITEAEFVDVMQKYGLVMKDIDTGKMKIKIYLDPETSLPKGDALCTYIKKESVQLALDLLNGSDLRGHLIKVERAKFTMKGEAYDPSLKPKKRRKKDKEKLKKIQEKLLDWRPDKLRGERSKHENIIIVKNLFEPAMFNKDVKLILEYQQDLREECLKCGSVKKVIIYDRHPEGVAQISFKEVEAADACVQLLNGRWFGQRKITAETWDGKTKYKISETDEQIKARLEKWEKFLESGEASKVEGDVVPLPGVKPSERKEDSNGSEQKETVNNQVDSELSDKTSNKNKDSDQDTVSSVGSDYETDEDMKT